MADWIPYQNGQVIDEVGLPFDGRFKILSQNNDRIITVTKSRWSNTPKIIDWLPNKPFNDIIKILDYYKSNSAVSFRFESCVSKHTYNVSLTDILDFMNISKDGVVDAQFKFKRPSGYTRLILA